MFTGIISNLGTVTDIDKSANWRIQIQTTYDTASIALGASISCNGCCLTVVETGANWFAVNVSEETRTKTTLNNWQTGTRINLERALKMGDELGGHLVSGHIDGVATIRDLTQKQNSWVFTIAPPPALIPLIPPKGSICLDGISLTVNDVMADCFTVTIIPHTYTCTNLHQLAPGASLNIEVDQIARYLQRIMQARI